MRFSWSSLICSGGMRTSLSLPTPVFTAYATLFPASCSSTTERARSMADRAAGSSSTTWELSQTSRSSSSFRSLPLMFNGFIGLIVSVVRAAEGADKQLFTRFCRRFRLERFFGAQQFRADELFIFKFRCDHYTLMKEVVHELRCQLEFLRFIRCFVAYVCMPIIEAERDLVVIGGNDEPTLAVRRRRDFHHQRSFINARILRQLRETH